MKITNLTYERWILGNVTQNLKKHKLNKIQYISDSLSSFKSTE